MLTKETLDELRWAVENGGGDVQNEDPFADANCWWIVKPHLVALLDVAEAALDATTRLAVALQAHIDDEEDEPVVQAAE